MLYFTLHKLSRPFTSAYRYFPVSLSLSLSLRPLVSDSSHARPKASLINKHPRRRSKLSWNPVLPLKWRSIAPESVHRALSITPTLPLSLFLSRSSLQDESLLRCPFYSAEHLNTSLSHFPTFPPHSRFSSFHEKGLSQLPLRSMPRGTRHPRMIIIVNSGTLEKRELNLKQQSPSSASISVSLFLPTLIEMVRALENRRFSTVTRLTSIP